MRESALGRARRTKRSAERSAWREAVLERDDFRCRMLSDDCAGRLHAHHVLPTSHGGKNELGNGLTLCRYHHLDVVHANPEWSYANGFLLRTPVVGAGDE